MKILHLFEVENHTQLIDNLLNYLRENQIEADSFNIVNWNLQGGTGSKLPLVIRIIKPFLRVPKIHGLLLLLLQKIVIINLSRNYHIIDIHFFSTSYDKVIPRLSGQNKKIKITVWGSDFYRVGKKRIEEQRSLYRLVDCIQVATKRMGTDFLKVFPEHFSKVRYAHFGLQQFDLIKKLDNKVELGNYRQKLGIPDTRIIIACGYNGSSSQQHLTIIESIASLKPPLRETVFLLFQVTYGLTTEYLKKITDNLLRADLSYKIITTPLSNNEVAKLRLIPEIAINISISDAYSASVQEQIYAGNIVIAGSWLPYDFLKERNIYFIETGINELTSKISDCLENLEAHKSRLAHNRDKIYEVSSWRSSVIDWVHIYREILNG